MPAAILFIAVCCLLSCRCTFPGQEVRVKLMSYNMQNLFDAVDDGTEYSEFDPGTDGGWSKDLYFKRLKAFGELFASMGSDLPDILLLQEVEKAAVLEKLRDDFLRLKGFRYSGCPRAPDSVVNVGYLSRFPVVNQISHLVNLPKGTPPRYVLEVHFDLYGETLVIFICHWKSRRGGARETEPQRLAAAELIRRRVEVLDGKYIIIAGDLNESWNESEKNNGLYPTAMTLLCNEENRENYGILIETKQESMTAGVKSFYSPWKEWGDSEGSYFYQDEWEQIDHFLFSKEFFYQEGWEFDSFSVVHNEKLLSYSGTPFAWRTSTAKGYSDHLPIVTEIVYKP